MKFFSYFSVSSAVQNQILDLNSWQFKREINSPYHTFLLLLSRRIFQKKNFNFVKGEFVYINWILLIYPFPLRLTHKFSIWIYDSLKENSILHFLLFFFYSEDEILIRKILILWKVNSFARMKFSLFFSFLRSWVANSPSEFVTVWKRIKFCISSFTSSTLKTNFW